MHDQNTLLFSQHLQVGIIQVSASAEHGHILSSIYHTVVLNAKYKVIIIIKPQTINPLVKVGK